MFEILTHHLDTKADNHRIKTIKYSPMMFISLIKLKLNYKLQFVVFSYFTYLS